MTSKTKAGLLVVLFMAVLFVGFILLMVGTMPDRSYHVVIDSVSGLDLPPPTSKDLVLDPQFNVTLRLAASSNPLRHECMDAKTYVQVSYRCGVPLAVSAPAPHRICVGPKKSTDVHFVAKGTGVRLPGSLMDSLAADMRGGVEAFDVRLRLDDSDSFWVASCGARRPRDGGSWCGEHWDMCAPQDTTTIDPVLYMPPPIIMPEE